MGQNPHDNDALSISPTWGCYMCLLQIFSAPESEHIIFLASRSIIMTAPYADRDSKMAHIGALHREYHFHECLATHKTFRQYSIETSLVPEIYFLFHKILIGLRLIVPVYFSIESHSVAGGSSLFYRWRYKSLLFHVPPLLSP